MDYTRKTFVEYISAGPFFNSISVSEVSTRDVSGLKVPKNAFCFNFYDIISIIVEADGQEVLLESARFNESPMHYYGGRIYTLAEIKRDFPNRKKLVSNLKGLGCKKAILCRTGNWHPFDDEVDIFVPID